MPKERGYTSLRIEPEIWKQTKIKAIEEDIGVSDLVEKSLSASLEILDKKETISDEQIVSIIKKKLGIK